MIGCREATGAPLQHTPRYSRRAALSTAGTSFVLGTIGVTGHRVLGAQEGTPSNIGDGGTMPVEDQLALQKIVDAGLGSTATPGALVGVWYPGRGDWTHAAGIRDVTTALPVTLDDHVRIASNTKTFVATVVLQLVDEGALSLEDPLESHLSGIPNGAEITLRQVLGMTAGMYDFVSDQTLLDAYIDDPLMYFQPEDALEIVRRSAPVFTPGERVEYCNSNYVLLGLIVEQVTGLPIATAIEERILSPLGLTGTSFPSTSDMPTPYMRGYDEGEAGAQLRDVTRSTPGVPWASGAMISTLADLKIWVEALATGVLISPEMQIERLRFGSIASGVVSLGYGLGLLSLNGLIGHNGGIFGFSSWVMYEPDSGASVVVVTNRGGTFTGTSDAIFLPLVTYLFPEKFPTEDVTGSTPVATPSA